MSADLRVPMTRAAFDALPVEEFPHFDALMNKNPPLDTAARAAPLSWFDPTVQEQMTPGQRALLALYMFGSLVGSGGTYSVLHDQPDLLLAAHSAAKLIGADFLTEALDRLRRDKTGFHFPHWFDAEFNDTAKPGADGWPVVTRIGLGNRTRERLVAWVKSHPDEFIRTPIGDPA